MCETQVANTTKVPEAEMPRVPDLDLEPGAYVSISRALIQASFAV